MAEFEKFSELPRELRDQIWSMAVRDDRPGVHVFGQYDETKRYKRGSRFLRSDDVVSGTWAAPSWRRYFENLNKGLGDENISTYLIDGGLWTDFVEDTYPRHDRTKEVFKKATTGCFDGTPLDLMTVFPHRDLFVLQFNDLQKVDWCFLGFEASMATSAEGFSVVRYVALEYNPKWSAELIHDLGDDIWAIVEGAFEMWPHVWKLWFIDHSLKRKKDAPVFKEKADNGYEINAFYASDRRLLEVDWHNWRDLEKEWEYIKPMEDKSDNGFSSSPDFLWGLDLELRDKALPDSGHFREPYCHIGILGWDEL
ncbi:uncharacterized protein FMAN_13799 [Fusarium mangiferae]|uniref:2EXR domain-containing protein n=1 Tax=Fusarium mangiferae TaxID=192010 RepID=A0A1L7TM61_FUSMA|nr:uncharacterized protein FMAN_13799 [Fusarium mangiferae]CVK95876.1 uncharacterized protein FMAN_13799 [Fusarium mangiferae]